MPIYLYKDKKTGKQIEVVRKFSDYTVPPTDEELAKLMTEEEIKEADWERQISSNIKVTRSLGYGTKGNWLVLLAACLTFLSSSRSEAKTKYKLLEATHLSVDYSQIKNYREPYIPEYSTDRYKSRDVIVNPQEENWKYGSAVNFNLNIIQINKYRLFWDNIVHMDATTSQVRRVGWNWKAGVTLIPNKILLFHHHHSEHWLEGYSSNRERYPVKDEYTLKFIFLNKE